MILYNFILYIYIWCVLIIGGLNAIPSALALCFALEQQHSAGSPANCSLRRGLLLWIGRPIEHWFSGNFVSQIHTKNPLKRSENGFAGAGKAAGRQDLRVMRCMRCYCGAIVVPWWALTDADGNIDPCHLSPSTSHVTLRRCAAADLKTRKEQTRWAGFSKNAQVKTQWRSLSILLTKWHPVRGKKWKKH